jgi:hypothetical protein
MLRARVVFARATAAADVIGDPLLSLRLALAAAPIDDTRVRAADLARRVDRLLASENDRARDAHVLRSACTSDVVQSARKDEQRADSHPQESSIDRERVADMRVARPLIRASSSERTRSIATARTLDERRRSLMTLTAKLSVLTIGIGVLAAPTSAWAVSAPLCTGSTGVTCTGGSPHITLNSTGGLSHPEIVPIFWGTYWNTGTARFKMVGQLQALANGPHFAGLNQYGGNSGTVGPVRVVPTAPVFTASAVPGAQCSNGNACTPGGTACSDGSACNVPASSIRPAIEAAIGNGWVPGPSANTDMLYTVFLPPGSLESDFNNSGTCSSACGSAYSGLSYRMAVTDGGAPGLAHELVEAISSNVTIDNCTHNDTGRKAGQTADLCGCISKSLYVGSSNPFSVKGYWSQQDNACVIPEGYNGLWAYDGASWTEVYTGTVRQAYAGDFGVVVTDTNDNLRSTSGATLGGPGAMFAVGNDAVYGLSPDGGGVWKYTTAGGWTSIGGPASSIMAGGHMVATDYSGNPWVYKSSTWTMFGGWSDQFAVNKAGVVALSGDHKGIWLNANATSSGWTQLGTTGGNEIFVGSEHTIAKTKRASSMDIELWNTSSTSWTSEGGPGNTFACTSDTNLYGLNWAQNGVRKDVGGTWPLVGGSAGKLVQKSDTTGRLYATGVVVY